MCLVNGDGGLCCSFTQRPLCCVVLLRVNWVLFTFVGAE
jgi:hypothetical protein